MDMAILGIILAIIGVAGIIYYVKKPFSIGHPAVAPIIFVAMIIVPFAFGWVAIPASEAPAGQIATSEVTWDITAVEIVGSGYDSNTSINNDTNTIQIALTITNGTSGTLDEDIVQANFTFEPIGGLGSTTDDLATIKYSTSYDMEFQSEKMLDKTDNIYGAEWEDDGGTSDYTGRQSMDLTQDGWATITYDFDEGTSSWIIEADSSDEFATLATWYITFSDNTGVIDTWTVNCILADYTAGS